MRSRWLIVCSCAMLLSGAMLTPLEAAVLIARYDFNNGANLGVDSSVNHNDGAASNVTQVTGPFAGTHAGYFDGSGLITVGPLSGGYTGLSGFTFAAWVNLDAAPTGYDGVISQGYLVNRLLLYRPDLHVLTNAYGHNDVGTPGSVIPLSQWFHIAFTVAPGNTATIYVNGAPIQTYSSLSPFDLSGQTTYIGAGESGGPYKMVGSIYDARIYDGALTADEVAQLDAPPSAIPEPSSFVVWSLLGGLGVTLAWWRKRKAA